jgi:hypothetical protein
VNTAITGNVNDLLHIIVTAELCISPGAGQRLQTGVEGLNGVISRLGNMGYVQLFAELEAGTEDMLDAMQARGGRPSGLHKEHYSKPHVIEKKKSRKHSGP